jgi:hypothetical protein
LAKTFELASTDQPAQVEVGRAFRGLVLGLTLSAVNAFGAFLALVALGGLGEWSGMQFLGIFGLLEVATGLAFVIGPNIWRLPVAEANTSARTKVRLAASTIFIPHWAAGAKTLGGTAFMVSSMVSEGVAPGTAGIVPFIVIVIAAVIGWSLVFARIGVEHPAGDVFQVRVIRPGGREHDLPGVSVGGLFVQLLLNIGVFPAVKLLPPSILFRPQLVPSSGLLLASFVVATLSMLAGLWSWKGRISWRAPSEQQREAEESA